MKKHVTVAAAAAIFIAGSANAVTLDVMVWDVLAPSPGCCAGNDENAQAAQTGGNLVLSSTGGNFFTDGFSKGTSTTSRDEAGVDWIVANRAADLTFNIDSSDLSTGFFSTNMTNVAPSIDDFFGTTLGGVAINGILGSIVRVRGNLSVTAGETFNVSSDDGYRLTVGGQVLAFLPGLNGNLAPVASNAVLATNDNAQFEFLWFEANRTGAAMQVTGNYVAAVPLPAAAWMLLAGLGGLFGMRRLRSKA